MKDLGVIFDSELNFVQHCKEKINTAYSYLGIIKRNLIYLDAFVMLSINQSMAVTDAGTKVPLYPYHTFYTLLVFKST